MENWNNHYIFPLLIPWRPDQTALIQEVALFCCTSFPMIRVHYIKKWYFLAAFSCTSKLGQCCFIMRSGWVRTRTKPFVLRKHFCSINYGTDPIPLAICRTNLDNHFLISTFFGESSGNPSSSSLLNGLKESLVNYMEMLILDPNVTRYWVHINVNMSGVIC